MQTVSLSVLVPDVLEQIPRGATPHVIERALASAAHKFCFDNEVWVEKVTQNAVAAQKSYTIALTWAAVIKRIKSLHYRTAAEVTDDENGTEIDLSDAEFFPRTNVIKFLDAPASASITNGLEFRLVLVPELGSAELDESLVNLYHQAFVSGAVADLCSRPGPMFNADTAQAARMAFDDIGASAFHNAQVGRGNGGLMVQKGYSLV